MAKTSTAAVPSMSGRKRWLIILCSVLAFVGVVAMAAPFFIPWDKLKDQATAFASQKLGRKLSIEKVEVSFFTGVKLLNVQLANGAGFSKDPLFSNASAKVNVSLLSLLSGKVIINSVEFKSPSILIEKAADGHFNFSGLGGSAPASTEAKSPEASAAPKELPIVLAALVITDGSIVYHDLGKGTTQSIKGLDFKLLGFSLQSGGDQRLEMKLTAEVEGKQIPVNLISNFKLDIPAETLALKSFDLTVPSVHLSANGDVKGFKTPVVDLKAALSVELASVAKDLLPPSTLKAVPGGLALNGDITFDLAAKGGVGNLDQMVLNGSLIIKNVGAKYGDYPALKDLVGTLAFDKAGADLPALTMDLGGSPVTVALNAKWGNLDNLLGGAKKLKADVSYKLTSPQLVLDPVMPILLADDSPEQLAAKAADAAKTGGIQDFSATVPAGLTLKGSILVDSLVYKKIKTGKFTQQLEIVKQKLKSATNLELYGGSFWERTHADLDKVGPPLGLQAAMSGVRFDGLVDDAATSMPDTAALQGLKGKVFGSASFKVDATGRGFKKPARFKNLKAEGSFNMKDGKILKTQWQEKIAAVIPHPATQAALRKDLVFQNLAGEFSYLSEKVTLKSFALGSGADWRGGDIFLQASGTLVPGGPIDFKVVPHFSPATVKLEGDLGQAFSDDKGWATYNYIAYAGPTTADAKADFSKGLENAAKGAVNRKIDQAKTQATDEVKKQVQQRAGDLLKQLPGGLFGK